MFHLNFHGKSYTLNDIFRIIFKFKLPVILTKTVMHIFKPLSLRKQIVFEGMTSFDGSAWEVFRQFYTDEGFSDWTFIWLVKGKNVSVPEVIKNDKRVKCYDFNSLSIKKLYDIARCRIVIFENFMIYTCNDKQMSIYLNHGFPIKNTIGTINVFENTKHVLCASEKYAAVQEQQFSYSHEKSLFLGSPRNDAFFRKSDEMSKLAIDKSKYSKTVIWMPTFRKLASGRVDGIKSTDTGLPIISDLKAFEHLNKFCAERKILLIVKLHPSQDISEIQVKDTDNIRILKADEFLINDVCLYSFMAQTDALISDYSSVSLDYLLLDKPIGYTLDDMDSYSRGFSVDNPEIFMVGHKINTQDELEAFLEDVSEEKDTYNKLRNDLKSEFWDYDDGRSSERVFKFISEKINTDI